MRTGTAAFTRTALCALLLVAGGATVFGQRLYWENPQSIAGPGIGYSSSSVGTQLMALGWQKIKPRSKDGTSGDLWLSIATSRDGISWKTHDEFYGPIRYAGITPGSEPRVYSMVVDAKDRIVVAVSTSDRETLILQSLDEGASFQQVQRLQSRGISGLPSLFATQSGGFLLFVSQGSSSVEVSTGAGAVSLALSRSADGKSWTEIAPFISSADTVPSPQLQPSHVSFQGKEYVVFQSLKPRNEITSTWQLFLKTSSNGGATWNAAIELSGFGANPSAFNNERPRIGATGTLLTLVWERSPFGAEKPQIWSARLDAEAAPSGTPELVAPESPSRFARVIAFKGQEYVLYADSSRTTTGIVLAQKTGKVWDYSPLPNTGLQNAQFPHAAVLGESLYVFWENQTGAGVASLVQLRPLTSVGAPVVKVIVPSTYTPGTSSPLGSATVGWSEPQPPDPSGIREYQYSWSFDDGTGPVEKEKRTISAFAAGTKLLSTQVMDRDGTWRFSIVAVDLAGNTTKAPATVAFIRDATPPAPVRFEVLDANGAQLLAAAAALPEDRAANSHTVDTNTFTLRWIPSGDKDIVGYTYNIQPGWTSLDEYRASKVAILAPPARVVTAATELKFSNRDNGTFAVTVQARDRAGNFSAPSTIAVSLSNYMQVTRVDAVTRKLDPQLGTMALTILGRGFTDNGTTRKIFLDRDGKAPWDMEFVPSAAVKVTDRVISGIVLDDTKESGAYRIALLQQRGTGEALYISNAAMVDFASPGTVKIGDFSLLLPRWIRGTRPQYALSFDALIVALVVALLIVLSVLATRKITSLAMEGAHLRAEVLALLEGKPTPGWEAREERKKRMQELKKRGVGLRLKFTLLIVVLVTMVVLGVSVPFALIMRNNQSTALATGLQNEAGILMDALASSAETQFPLGTDGYIAALDIPKLRVAMKAATYATITGPNPERSPEYKPIDSKDYVWASDQKAFTDQIKAQSFQAAVQTVDDEISRSIAAQLQKKIDADAAAKFATLVDEYRTLKGEQATLKARTDAVSKARYAEVNLLLGSKAKEIDAQARIEYGTASTVETFDALNLPPTYHFYRPIIFYNRAVLSADTSFFQGLIRLEVYTEDIRKKITDAVNTAILFAGLIALLAIALGVVGAIIMANITITPIRKLAQGVAFIRDTEDKENLKDHIISVTSKDEIGTLADTVNDMTQGLVKAAVANKELLQGIDVQKRFLPLLKDESGGKQSTALEENARMEIFGYYKGAKGVSGDYFDFKRLDDTYYALIKCDVSGKGVSAALIMVEVATLFINYFRDWPKRKENITRIKDPKARERAHRELESLAPLVYTINDMVEERGFVGRFAALTVLLFNSATGVATICNAGDTVINIYSVEKRSMVHAQLPNSPAAGMFPSMLVDMKNPYKQVQQQLESGDVLFLATDGFEDAIHTFRDASFQEMVCNEPGLAEKEHHTANQGDHEQGLPLERFGVPREDELINAVFNKQRFVLVRNHNPIPDEEIVFDFSTCAGTAQDAVLALVAVDRVYRMVPDPRLGEENKITVESKVVDFLKEHFLQFDRYFSHRLESGKNAGSVTFTHSMEDEQSDDLTILVIRRK
jgi:methyl-accepting chemotaxis protein